MKKIVILIYIIFFVHFHLFSQKDDNKLFIKYGYNAIPLHIKRTEATRWMIFPMFEGGYRINKKISFIGSYLHHDVRLSKFSSEKYYYYSETPLLNSYNEAQMYIGNKVFPSEFFSYVFIGIHFLALDKDIIELQTNFQIGYRQGHTFLFSHVSEEPSNPNGFEAHLTVLSSNSPGMKFAVSPRISITDFAFLESSLGSYVFTNWPVLQLFGSFQLGIRLL